ncbi:MAG: hypothetical protein ACRDMV_03750 [Streptosporangiales bacterium]
MSPWARRPRHPKEPLRFGFTVRGRSYEFTFDREPGARRAEQESTRPRRALRHKPQHARQTRSRAAAAALGRFTGSVYSSARGGLQRGWNGARNRGFPGKGLIPRSRAEAFENARITGAMWLSVGTAWGVSATMGASQAFGFQLGVSPLQSYISGVLDRQRDGKKLFGRWPRQEKVKHGRIGAVGALGLGTSLATSLATGGSATAAFGAAVAASPLQGVVSAQALRMSEGRRSINPLGPRGRWMQRDSDEIKRWVGISSLGTGGAAIASAVGGASAGFGTAFGVGLLQGRYSARVNTARSRREAIAPDRPEDWLGRRPGDIPQAGIREKVAGKVGWTRGKRQQSGRQPAGSSPKSRPWPRRSSREPMTARQARMHADAQTLITHADAERARSAWRKTYALEDRAARFHEGVAAKRVAAGEAGRRADRLDKVAIGKDSQAKRLRDLAAELDGASRATGKRGLSRREAQDLVPQGGLSAQVGETADGVRGLARQAEHEAQQLRARAQHNRSERTQLRGEAKNGAKQAVTLYDDARKVDAKKLGETAERSAKRGQQAAKRAADISSQRKKPPPRSR